MPFWRSSHLAGLDVTSFNVIRHRMQGWVRRAIPDWEDIVLGMLSLPFIALIDQQVDFQAIGTLHGSPIAGTILLSAAVSGVVTIWLAPKPSGSPSDPEVRRANMMRAAGSVGLAIIAYFGAFALLIPYGAVGFAGAPLVMVVLLVASIYGAYIPSPKSSERTRRILALPLQVAAMAFFVSTATAMRDGAHSPNDRLIVLAIIPFLFVPYLYLVAGPRALAGHSTTWPQRIAGFIFALACAATGLEFVL